MKDPDLILNGIKPENYYLTCGPTAKCDRPTEHVEIYVFICSEERDKGVQNLLQIEKKAHMILPTVWQKSNTLLLYWNGAEIGKKTPYLDKVSMALADWEVPSLLQP